MGKSWEIPKGESGDINGRCTENTMAEWKRTTRAKMIHKKLHRFFSKVWIYQNGNRNPEIEEGHAMQLTKVWRYQKVN
jgi:hypothetical protein